MLSLDWRPLRVDDGTVPDQRDRMITWAGDGSAFAITGDDGATWLIDAVTFARVRRLREKLVALAAGTAFTYNDETGAVAATDIATGSRYSLCGAVRSHISAGASTTRLAVVRSWRSQGVVLTWDLLAPDAEPVRHDDCPAGLDTRVAFAEGGAVVRIIGTPSILEPQTTLLWDSATNAAVDVGSRITFTEPVRWALAPDATTLAYAGSLDGRPTIAIADATSVAVRTRIAVPAAADNYVRQMCFSPDNSWLIALYGPANGPGAVAVFDACSGRQLAGYAQPDSEWLETSRVNITAANQLVWTQRRGGWQLADVPAQARISLV